MEVVVYFVKVTLTKCGHHQSEVEVVVVVYLIMVIRCEMWKCFLNKFWSLLNNYLLQALGASRD